MLPSMAGAERSHSRVYSCADGPAPAHRSESHLQGQRVAPSLHWATTASAREQRNRNSHGEHVSERSVIARAGQPYLTWCACQTSFACCTPAVCASCQCHVVGSCSHSAAQRDVHAPLCRRECTGSDPSCSYVVHVLCCMSNAASFYAGVPDAIRRRDRARRARLCDGCGSAAAG